jgi:hypothetical protein
MLSSLGIEPPILLYRATCGKCRAASIVLVVLMCGRIRRVPVDAPEAISIYARFHQQPGKLALVYRERFRTGWAISVSILPALAGTARKSLIQRMRGASWNHRRGGDAFQQLCVVDRYYWRSGCLLIKKQALQ